MYQPETEYYLGQNEQNGYAIVEHINHRFPHEGRCVFSVCEYGISDDSGAPISYDDTFVEIEEDVRKQAMRMFRDVERKLVLIGNEGSTPIYHVVSLHQGHELFQSFYCDKYDLDFDPDPFTLDDLGTTLEELMEDCFLISKETYDKALQAARNGIAQITAYLSDQYIQHSGIQETSL